MPVCFAQFPPHLRAGVKHFLSKTSPSSDKYAQYPLPPCVVQVFHLRPVCWLVQPPNTHSPGPPPCFWQRPLSLEVVVHPATEHGFFPPPCFLQYGDARLCALVVHPATLHVPCAPCLAQTPRATARVVQPSSLHTVLLRPPCLEQESVQGGRLHHPRASTWRLRQARRTGNVQVCRMYQQRVQSCISVLQETRRRKEAVLRGGLHHQLPTQGPLPETRRRSR